MNTINKPKIGFVGSVNAMPFHYAIRFKEEGYDVKYIVESKKEMALNRPESHFPSISYPYPEWIIETNFININLRVLFPRLLARKILAEMIDRDVIFLCGYGIALSKYLPKCAKKIIIFSGADLYEGCNLMSAKDVARRKSKNFLLVLLKSWALRKIGKNSIYGVKSAEVTTFHPKGFMRDADMLLQNLLSKKQRDLRRYDVNFEKLGLFYKKPVKRDTLTILIPVRIMISVDESNFNEYKGNDLIIAGIGRFYKNNKNIKVHLFEKGSEKDILIIKKMIDFYQLNNVVIWHKQMSLASLIQLYDEADICFDQVGRHFMGAVGLYALFMGKTLIANSKIYLLKDMLNITDPVPILEANNASEIEVALNQAKSFSFREKTAPISHEFSKKYFSIDRIYCEYLKIIDSRIR